MCTRWTHGTHSGFCSAQNVDKTHSVTCFVDTCVATPRMAAADLHNDCTQYAFLRRYNTERSAFAVAGVPEVDGTVRSVLLKRVGCFDAGADARREARIAGYLGRMGASDVAVTPTAFALRKDGSFTWLWIEFPLCSCNLLTLWDRAGATVSPLQRHVLCADVAAAVARLHHLGVLHCDVKQENIVLGADGVARLLDYDCSLDAWEATGYTEQCTKTPMATVTVRPPEWDPDSTQRAFLPHTACAGDVFSTSLTVLCTLLLDHPLNEAYVSATLPEDTGGASTRRFRRNMLERLLQRKRQNDKALSCTAACTSVLASGLHMTAERRPSAQTLADALAQGARGTSSAADACGQLQTMATNAAFQPPSSTTKDDKQDGARWVRVPVPWAAAGEPHDAVHAVTLRNAQALQEVAEEMCTWACTLAAGAGRLSDAQVTTQWRRGARMLCMAIAAVQLEEHYTHCKAHMQMCSGKPFSYAEVPTSVLVQCIELGAWTGLSGQADNTLALVLASAQHCGALLPPHVQWRTLALFATLDGVQECLLHPKACAEAVLSDTVPEVVAVVVRAGLRTLHISAPAAAARAMELARVPIMPVTAPGAVRSATQ